MLSGVFGHQLQLPSPVCPCPYPCPHSRGLMMSHTAYSLVLSSGPAVTCVPNWEPHTAPLRLIPALKCLLCPDGSTRAASLPPPKWTHYPMDALTHLKCTLGILPLSLGTLSSADRYLLRDVPKHCQGQEILIPVQERIGRVWFYSLHSSGFPVSNALVSAPVLHFHPAWAQFTRGCTSPWVTVSSLSGHRFLPLNGFYGRISPTSLTWSFLNKGHVLGTSRVGFCQLHHHGSCLPGPRGISNLGTLAQKICACWPPVTPGQSVSYWPLGETLLWDDVRASE